MYFQSAYVTGNELIIDGGWSLWLTLPANGNSYYDGQKMRMVFLAKIEIMHVISFQTNLLQSLSRLILLINFSLNRETLK